MDFTRTSRWVEDGHRTADPEHSSFAGVFHERVSILHLPIPHWMILMLRQLILRIPIFKLCHQKLTMSFTVPNLALRILTKFILFILLFMEVNQAVQIFGSTFGHLWCIFVLLHARLILISGWDKFRKMVVLPFGNMSYFMLMTPSVALVTPRRY